MTQADQNKSAPAVKKDKKEVIDEVWTEDRIKGYLDLDTVSGVDRDFHQLIRAYQSMKLDDFGKFIAFFSADNRDINAQNPEGETALSIILQHRHGQDYAQILKQSGAN